MTASSSSGRIALSYDTIRNMTSPEEKANEARSYFANVPIEELLKLDTAANLRDYIPDHPGKHRTQAHKAIGQTLRERSDRFIQLSSGITVAASDIEIDDNRKVITVTNGSIINGAQTQGEIRLFLDEMKTAADEADEIFTPDFHARVEFMVDPEVPFIVDAAIARNTSTNIQRISMAGKKRYFDELDASFRRTFPKFHLAKSETDTGEEFVDTMRLLQVLWAMLPEKLLPSSGRSTAEARLKSYKNRAFCLVDFEKDVVDKENATDPKIRAGADARYRCMIDLAGPAWKQYLRWRHHKEWEGRRLKQSTRAIRRTDGGYTVADGVIFPILSAMSLFIEKEPVTGKYRFDIPGVFEEKDMIEAARDQLTAHKGNPMLMGRNAAVYDAMTMLTRMVLRVSDRMAAGSAIA
jgi:AIPR protein